MKQKVLTHLPQQGFPELPKLATYKRLVAKTPMLMHKHEHVFELIYIASGMQFRGTRGNNMPLCGGQGFIVRPNTGHSTGIMPQGTGRVYWMHLDTRHPIAGLPQEESDYIFQALLDREIPRVDVGLKCSYMFEDLFTQARKNMSSYQKLSFRRNLINILHKYISDQEEDDSLNAFHVLLKHISDSPQLWHNPAALAKEAGCSLSRLRARTKELSGMSLGDLLLHLRIVEASRKLLHNPQQSITEIALEMEFSSSQYFSTVFKRYMAMSPSEFRSDLEKMIGKRRAFRLGIGENKRDS